MKILITGITGFVGSNLADFLNKKGFKIFGLVRENSDTNHLIKNNIEYLVYDESKIIDFFNKNQFDGVIHLASKFIVNHKFEDINDIINSNITLPSKLLDLSVKNNVKWFINTGTFWQHYNNEEYSPVNFYSSAKKSFEDVSKYYYQDSKITFLTIKLTDTYGFGDKRNKILNLWKNLIEKEEELNMSKGEQFIDLVYIDDVVLGYFNIINKLKNENRELLNGKTFTISSKKPLKLIELAEIFEKISNKNLKINWGALEYRNREFMTPYKNINPIDGWSPTIDLEGGLKKFLDL